MTGGPPKEGEADIENETINQLYSGMGQTQPRPVMHPFGMASKAPVDTLNVAVKSGHHVGNRMVIGHRDKLRPKDVKDGEISIYSSDGKTVLRRIDVSSDKITVGSKEADEPLVLGNVQKEFQEDWIKAWLEAPSIGVCVLGPVFLSPAIRAKFEGFLAKFITAEDTNIISQENFTERKKEE